MEPNSSRRARPIAQLAVLALLLPFWLHAQAPMTIVSPHPGERVGARAVYWIRWTSPDVAGNARYVAFFRTAAGLHEVCAAEPSDRQCEWFHPGSAPAPTGTIVVEARSSTGAVLARAESGPFEIASENLGGEWSYLDIGDAGRSGGVHVTSDGTYVVRGAGDDIWGTADAFHYVFREITNSEDFNARVTLTDLDGSEAWTKAGLMLRSHLLPTSPHHFILASRDRGLAYQRRLSNGGETLHTTVSPSSTLPVTFDVMRRAGYTVIQVQRDGVRQQVASFNFEGWLVIGPAVSSHDRGVLATAAFDDVVAENVFDPAVNILSPEAGQEAVAGVPLTIQWSYGRPIDTATVSYSVDNGQSWTVIPGCAAIRSTTCVWESPGPESEAARIRIVADDPDDPAAWTASWPFAIRSGPMGALPPGWTSGDVGAVAAHGSASYDAAHAQFVVTGSGRDIWDAADEFHFVSRTIVDEGTLGVEFTARVSSVQPVHRWTKAGLMVRAHRGAGAAHVAAFVTPSAEKGVAFQRRRSDGAQSVHTAGPAITAPVWLKFIVGAGQVRAYYRHAAADDWVFLGQDRVALSPPYEAGLAVSSHVDGSLARATFDNVAIMARDVISGHADIGNLRLPGATGINDIERILDADGADIWGTADAFRYHYGSASPNAVLVARVRSLQPTHRWAKAGVMMRANLSPGSPHVMLVASAGMGVAMQYRAVANGPSATVAIVPGAAPVWLRVIRSGDVVRGEVSDDAVTWRPVGRITVALGRDATAGLAVTSHDRARVARGVFTDVVLRP